MSPVTEVPTHRDAPKILSTTALKSIAQSLGAAENAGAPALRSVAGRMLRAGVAEWGEKATAEIQAVCEEAVDKAVRDWKKRETDLNRQIVRAVAVTHTQTLMDEWAATTTAQVDAEVDKRGLISTEVLDAIVFTRAKRQGETKAVQTNARECLDEEFMIWFVGQLGERGIDNTNRLMFRLLLVAALDWMRDQPDRWREPRRAEV